MLVVETVARIRREYFVKGTRDRVPGRLTCVSVPTANGADTAPAELRDFCRLGFAGVDLLGMQECVARPAGFEPATPSLEGSCSIQLSYGRVGSAHSVVCIA